MAARAIHGSPGTNSDIAESIAGETSLSGLPVSLRDHNLSSNHPDPLGIRTTLADEKKRMRSHRLIELGAIMSISIACIIVIVVTVGMMASTKTRMMACKHIFKSILYLVNIMRCLYMFDN